MAFYKFGEGQLFRTAHLAEHLLLAKQHEDDTCIRLYFDDEVEIDCVSGDWKQLFSFLQDKVRCYPVPKEGFFTETFLTCMHYMMPEYVVFQNRTIITGIPQVMKEVEKQLVVENAAPTEKLQDVLAISVRWEARVHNLHYVDRVETVQGLPRCEGDEWRVLYVSSMNCILRSSFADRVLRVICRDHERDSEKVVVTFLSSSSRVEMELPHREPDDFYVLLSREHQFVAGVRDDLICCALENEGMLQLIFHRDSPVLVGWRLFLPSSPELIQQLREQLGLTMFEVGKARLFVRPSFLQDVDDLSTTTDRITFCVNKMDYSLSFDSASQCLSFMKRLSRLIQ
jgi:hypothetical protein